MATGGNYEKLMKLAEQCPHGEAVPSCPLTDLRSLPTDCRHENIRMLDPDLVNSILDYHENCSDLRDYSVV